MWLLMADGRRRMRWMDVAEATCTGQLENLGRERWYQECEESPKRQV